MRVILFTAKTYEGGRVISPHFTGIKKTPQLRRFLKYVQTNYIALKRASSCSCASAKERIPSASFSVAIASWLCNQRN